MFRVKVMVRVRDRVRDRVRVMFRVRVRVRVRFRVRRVAMSMLGAMMYCMPAAWHRAIVVQTMRADSGQDMISTGMISTGMISTRGSVQTIGPQALR